MNGISDHEAILVKSIITAHLSYSSKRTIHLWSQADFQVIRKRIGLLCEEFTSFYSSSTSVETLWTNFIKICNTCLDLISTKLSSHSFKQPWITNHIKSLLDKSNVPITTHAKQMRYNTGPSIITSKENVIISMCCS